MFFTYAEKQGNVFFDGWQMREIAFDSLRRHLYYSDYVPPEKIAYPNANDNPFPTSAPSDNSSAAGEESSTSLSSAAENLATANLARRLPVSPVNQQRHFTDVPPPPNNPEDILWRKKIKVDMIVIVGKEHEFLLEDSHLKEADLFQLEIHGEVRQMAAGETPSPGPLLCPSAGLSGLPERCTVENDEFIRDPFFLRELYEALRDQFSSLRMERERAELASGQPVIPAASRKIQTLDSPRGKGASAARGRRIKVVLRMRTDYEFRRFWYVVQTVLGYDKLSARPYRGLPPYDPRNGLIFSMIPMCVWHTFKTLDKAVFYTFLRGDLVGRNSANQLCVTLRGAYLCVTHDTVLVMRDTGNIPRWIKLQQVREFHHNSTSSRPFVAFLSDPGAPDIIFIPQPPVFGADAIHRFSATLEVLRLYHVLHETCFASLEIRRVINMEEIPEMSVRGFVTRYEEEMGRTLDFDPARGYAGVLSCPLPKEQLAQVWREVQGIYAARDPVVVSQAAIPLYQNNTNDTDLTAEQLETLSRRLARERSSRDDIVGLPYEEAHRIEAPVRRNSRLHGRHHLTPPHLRPGTSRQSSTDVAGLHVDPQSIHAASATRRRGETLPVMSHHLRRSHTAEADVNSSHSRLGRDGDGSERGIAAGDTSLDVSVASPTASPTTPAGAYTQSFRAVGSPTTSRGSSVVQPSRVGGTHVPPSSTPTAAAPAVASPTSSSRHPNAFTHSHAGRAELPHHRLETPQIGADHQEEVPAGLGASPPMGTSADVANASFVSSPYGANSVQYQIPGARYLTADEMKGAGSAVGVDHHTVLMSQTPLGGEGTVHAFLASSEMNVSQIVNRSITAMHVAASLSEKRRDSTAAKSDPGKAPVSQPSSSSAKNRKGSTSSRSASKNKESTVET